MTYYFHLYFKVGNKSTVKHKLLLFYLAIISSVGQPPFPQCSLTKPAASPKMKPTTRHTSKPNSSFRTPIF